MLQFFKRKCVRTVCSAVFGALFLLFGNAVNADPILFGPPHTISIAFKNETNLQAAMNELSHGIGASFGSIETFTKVVDFGSVTKTVTFKRAYTTRGTPFVELLTADANRKPWKGGPLDATTVVFAVDDLAAAEAQVQAQAGVTFVARVAGEYAYYELVDGILVKIVDRTMVPDPATSTTNTPPVGTFDFGLMNHFSTATKIGHGSNPDDYDTAVAQMSGLSGLTWSPALTFENVPYIRGNGSSVFVTNRHQGFSVEGGPYLDFIDADPTISPWIAKNTVSESSIVWAVEDFAAAETQLLNAGFTKVIAVDVPGVDLAYYKATEGLTVQIAQAALLPPPPLRSNG